jgi:hypothetical protein
MSSDTRTYEDFRFSWPILLASSLSSFFVPLLSSPSLSPLSFILEDLPSSSSSLPANEAFRFLSLFFLFLVWRAISVLIGRSGRCTPGRSGIVQVPRRCHIVVSASDKRQAALELSQPRPSLARPSKPIAVSTPPPSTRMASEALAAKTSAISPLFLGAARPIKDA